MDDHITALQVKISQLKQELDTISSQDSALSELIARDGAVARQLEALEEDLRKESGSKLKFFSFRIVSILCLSL